MADVWRPGDTWRPLDPREVALLDALTSLDFDGAAALKAQIPFATAQQGLRLWLRLPQPEGRREPGAGC